jgi:hypothetical protein
MADEHKPSRFRAVIKNALVWGVTWGALGTAVATLIRLTDKIPLGHAIMDGIGMGVRIGVVGAIVGVAFSTFISLAYRGRRLSEISWPRFGLGGLILGGLFVPGFLQATHLLSDGTLMPWNLISDDFIYSALFGGITAAGTMFLAQRDEAKNPAVVQAIPDRIERPSLGQGDMEYQEGQRARTEERR